MEVNKCIPPDSIIIFPIPTEFNEKLVVGKVLERYEDYKYCIKSLHNKDIYYMSYKTEWDIMYSIKVGYYIITDLLLEDNKILKHKFFMHGCLILEGKVVSIEDDNCTIETPYGEYSYVVEINNKWKTIYPDEIGKKIIDKRELEYIDEALKLKNYYEDVIIDEIVIDL